MYCNWWDAFDIRFEDILKRICQTWNFKAKLSKSPNDDTISNDYAQSSKLNNEVTLSLGANPLLSVVTKLPKPNSNSCTNYYAWLLWVDFLVPKSDLILKIIVFVNKIYNIVKIATYICLLLLQEYWDSEEKHNNVIAS